MGRVIYTQTLGWKPDSKGQYPKDSVFGKVDAKLRHYADLIKDYLPGK